MKLRALLVVCVIGTALVPAASAADGFPRFYDLVGPFATSFYPHGPDAGMSADDADEFASSAGEVFRTTGYEGLGVAEVDLRGVGGSLDLTISEDPSGLARVAIGFCNDDCDPDPAHPDDRPNCFNKRVADGHTPDRCYGPAGSLSDVPVQTSWAELYLVDAPEGEIRIDN